MSVQGYLSHLQDVDAIENLQIGLTNLEGQGKIAIIDASDDKCWNFCARYAWRISAQVWLASASISKHGAPAMFAKALPLGANATFAQLLVLGFNFLAFCDMFHHMLSILFSSMQDSVRFWVVSMGIHWARTDQTRKKQRLLQIYSIWRFPMHFHSFATSPVTFRLNLCPSWAMLSNKRPALHRLSLTAKQQQTFNVFARSWAAERWMCPADPCGVSNNDAQLFGRDMELGCDELWPMRFFVFRRRSA